MVFDPMILARAMRGFTRAAGGAGDALSGGLEQMMTGGMPSPGFQDMAPSPMIMDRREPSMPEMIGAPDIADSFNPAMPQPDQLARAMMNSVPNVDTKSIPVMPKAGPNEQQVLNSAQVGGDAQYQAGDMHKLFMQGIANPEPHSIPPEMIAAAQKNMMGGDDQSGRPPMHSGYSQGSSQSGQFSAAQRELPGGMMRQSKPWQPPMASYQQPAEEAPVEMPEVSVRSGMAKQVSPNSPERQAYLAQKAEEAAHMAQEMKQIRMARAQADRMGRAGISPEMQLVYQMAGQGGPNNPMTAGLMFGGDAYTSAMNNQARLAGAQMEANSRLDVENLRGQREQGLQQSELGFKREALGAEREDRREDRSERRADRQEDRGLKERELEIKGRDVDNEGEYRTKDLELKGDANAIQRSIVDKKLNHEEREFNAANPQVTSEEMIDKHIPKEQQLQLEQEYDQFGKNWFMGNKGYPDRVFFPAGNPFVDDDSEFVSEMQARHPEIDSNWLRIWMGHIKTRTGKK